MVFHHPLPLRQDATSASGIRPVRMLAAFRELGYEVDVVAGYAKERQVAMRAVREKLRSGHRYSFMYAESSTEPTPLTEPHHLPLAPWSDSNFFAQLKRHDVPIGLFYRDIYWRFPTYDAMVPWAKRTVARYFYRRDLRIYERTLTRLYLPSMAMAAQVPVVAPSRVAALPPGFSPTTDVPQGKAEAGRLRLLYVGGMSAHYQMHALFEAMARRPEVSLTVCTRAAEWAAVRGEYAAWLGDNIRVVHASGGDLAPLYAACDVAVVFVQPDEYWEFAAPVKVYEYLGRGRPLLASAGTLAGRFVAENDLGWVIPYQADAAAALLGELAGNPAKVNEKAATCVACAPRHTWLARARQVALDLAGEA